MYSHDIYSISAAKDDEEAEDVGEGGVLSCAMRRAVRTLSLEHGNQEKGKTWSGKPKRPDLLDLVGGFTWFYAISAYFNMFKAFFEMIIDNRAAWAATFFHTARLPSHSTRSIET